MGAIVSTLRKELETILSDEEIYRASLVRRGLNIEIVQAPNEDDDACCIRCKAMPFLSVVRCKCLPTAVRCLRHAMDACDCAAGERTLEIRVVDSRLRELIKALFFGDGIQTKDDAAKARVDFSANVNRVAVNRAPPPKPKVVLPKPKNRKTAAGASGTRVSTPPAAHRRIESRRCFHRARSSAQASQVRNTRRRWDAAEMVADFEVAVERLGGVDAATGKKLAEALSAHDVTRDQCASRLQKHREKIKSKRGRARNLVNVIPSRSRASQHGVQTTPRRRQPTRPRLERASPRKDARAPVSLKSLLGAMEPRATS